MTRTLLVLTLLALTNISFAQYFYKDIIALKGAAAEIAVIKENKVKNIRLKSFEDDGSASDGFFAEKKFSRDYRKAELFTRTNYSGASLLTTFYNANGTIESTFDSSEIATTRIKYTYDDDNRLINTFSVIRSADDDFVNEITEEHIYVYGEEFYPDKMLRVKNRKDTVEILFMLDENKNLAIEKDSRTGSKYYYYYDAKSRLTDVAHINDFRQKLLPEYMFEYNSAGQISQMITTQEGGGGNDYLLWKYTYSNGLRMTESCYSKERRLLGRIEYEYK